MRRELILDTRIAEPNNQFHAVSISSACAHGEVRLSSRASVLCAARDLGEPRDSTEPALRERKRPKGAFGSLPYFFSFFSAFFSAFSGFSAAAASPSSSVSALPFLMTSGSAGAAPASAATTTSSFTDVTWATGWFASERNFSFSLCGKSDTRSTLPNVSSLTSTSMWLGISAGRHSISTSRSICSRIPPSVFTPSGTPCSTIGTLTRKALSMAMRFRSMCSRWPLIGSYCQSTIMALVRSPPCSARSKIVLCPLSERKMRNTCRGSTLTGSASLLAPYSTPGILPSRRTRRAWFLVPASRGCASKMFCSKVVAIISIPSKSVPSNTVILRRRLYRRRRISVSTGPSPQPGLDKQLTNRRLFVIGLNRPPNQSRNRKHPDLRLSLSLFGQRDSIRNHHFPDHRLRNVLHRRPRQHGVRRTGIHPGSAVLHQGGRGFHQRASRIDQVVDDQTSPPVHVADHVHHFGHVHFHAPFVDDGQRRVHLLREKSRPLHAARVR